MKKIVLGSLLLIVTCFAEVRKSSPACSNLEDLKQVTSALKGKMSLENIYKYTLQYNCEIINVGDKIKVIGEPIENRYIRIRSEKLKTNFYTLLNSVSISTSNLTPEVSGSITYGRDFGVKNKSREGAKNKIKEQKDRRLK